MADAVDTGERREAAAPLGLDPRILRPATFPPFDLYVRAREGGGLVLFRKANEPVYANIYEKLRRGGFDTVYARGEERDLCLGYVEDNLPSILADDALPARQSGEWVYRLACRAMEALLHGPNSPADYNRVKALTDLAALLLQCHPGIEWDMVDCAPLSYSTHAHCVNVSILLTSFATRVLGVTEQMPLAEIALGGILHDLGKAMISPEILTKPAALTRREFAQVKKHPRYGVKMAQPFLREAAIAQCVIAQHHENSSGDGYPDGRSGDGINAFARAARIADTFDALTSHRPYGPALDPYRALNMMVSEMRGQFDLPMLRKFIRHLGSQADQETMTVQAPADLLAQTPAALQEGPAALAEDAALHEDLPADDAVGTAALAPDEPQPAAAQEAPVALPNADVPVAPAAPAAQGAPVVPVSVFRAEPIEEGAGSRSQAASASPAAGPAPAGKEVVTAAAGGDTETSVEALPQAAPRPDAEAAVLLDQAVQVKLDAIRELSEEQSQHAAFITNVLGALKDAFAGPLGRAFRHGGTGAGAPASAEAEVAIARDLFPLVWQLDEWRDRFLERTPPVPEALRLRTEVLACLGALRDDLVAVLRAHDVEVIEERQDAAAGAAVEQPQLGAAPRRIRRVGFVRRSGAETEVIEPPRVVLYADLRKAG
jgi:hypothetical protein